MAEAGAVPATGAPDGNAATQAKVATKVLVVATKCIVQPLFSWTCRESGLVGLVATAPRFLWADADALHMLHLCFDCLRIR